MKRIYTAVIVPAIIALGIMSYASENKKELPIFDFENKQCYSSFIREKYSEEIQKNGDCRFKINTEIKEKNGKFGIYQKGTKKWTTPPIYTNLTSCTVGEINDGIFFHTIADGKEKIIDYKNNTLYSSDKYKLNCDINVKEIQTEYNGKYGIVRFDGKEIIKPEYDSIICQHPASPPDSFYFIVQKGNKYGVADYNGNFLISLQYKEIREFINYYFKTHKDNKYGIIDIYGNQIANEEYDKVDIDGFSTGKPFFLVLKEWKQGVLDLDGNIILPIEFFGIWPLSEGYFSIKKSPKDQDGFYLAKEGGQILTAKPYKFISALNFGNSEEKERGKYLNVFRIEEDGKENTKCLQKCKPKKTKEDIDFEEIIEEEKCTAICHYDTKLYGIINDKGEVVIKPTSDFKILNAINNEMFVVIYNKRYGIINKNKLILKLNPQYYIFDYRKGYLLIGSKKNNDEYILTPDELIKRKGNLMFLKKYIPYTYKSIDNNCFRIAQKKDIFSFFEKKPKITVFCENK